MTVFSFYLFLNHFQVLILSQVFASFPFRLYSHTPLSPLWKMLPFHMALSLLFQHLVLPLVPSGLEYLHESQVTVLSVVSLPLAHLHRQSLH